MREDRGEKEEEKRVGEREKLRGQRRVREVKRGEKREKLSEERGCERCKERG